MDLDSPLCGWEWPAAPAQVPCPGPEAPPSSSVAASSPFCGLGLDVLPGPHCGRSPGLCPGPFPSRAALQSWRKCPLCPLPAPARPASLWRPGEHFCGVLATTWAPVQGRVSSSIPRKVPTALPVLAANGGHRSFPGRGPLGGSSGHLAHLSTSAQTACPLQALLVVANQRRVQSSGCAGHEATPVP